MSVTITRQTDGTFEVHLHQEYPTMGAIVNFAVSTMGHLLQSNGKTMTLDQFATVIEINGISRGMERVTVPIVTLLRDSQLKDDELYNAGVKLIRMVGGK